MYRALLDEKSDAEIARIVKFYDYLEIQPTGNNMFMIHSDKIENVNSVEDIQNMNRKIVRLGEQFNKPVVATCDVHFLDPADEVYPVSYTHLYGDRILMMHQGKIVLDKVGEEKNRLNTDEIMGIFNRISVECGN